MEVGGQAFALVGIENGECFEKVNVLGDGVAGLGGLFLLDGGRKKDGAAGRTFSHRAAQLLGLQEREPKWAGKPKSRRGHPKRQDV
jgi:hypothetical protein